MQPSDSTPFGTNGGHYRTNGGCVSHPRKAHNLVQIIVCYNYHSAELRVRGLPKNGTLVHLYIWTLVHLYLRFSPIVVQMGDDHYQHLGDAAIDALSRPSCAHYRTDGGRIVVQMGDDTIDALSRPSYAPLSYRWGMRQPPSESTQLRM